MYVFFYQFVKCFATVKCTQIITLLQNKKVVFNIEIFIQIYVNLPKLSTFISYFVMHHLRLLCSFFG